MWYFQAFFLWWTIFWVWNCLTESLSWKRSWYQRGFICLVFSRSTSHFQSPFGFTALAPLCVCEEAKAWGIGVWMKVGHSRFCLVARQNSRLSQTLPEWWRTLLFDWCSEKTLESARAPDLYVLSLPCWLTCAKQHCDGIWHSNGPTKQMGSGQVVEGAGSQV